MSKIVKLFENFKNKSELRDNIESCLVELVDKGFYLNTTIYDSYINIEIERVNNSENLDIVALNNSAEEFSIDDIQDDVIQLIDYISAKYKNLKISFVPETRWNNDTYEDLHLIPNDLDLIRFDIYFNWIYSEEANSGPLVYLL